VICAYKSNCPNVLAGGITGQLNTVNFPIYNKYLGSVKVVMSDGFFVLNRREEISVPHQQLSDSRSCSSKGKDI